MSANKISRSFADWISEFKEVDAPMGDFAYDVSQSKDYPENESYERLLQYFEYKSRWHDNPEILKLFKIAWEFHNSLISDN